MFPMKQTNDSLVKRVGSGVVPVGIWNGSLKTVSGHSNISAPIYNIMLKDKTNHFHQIKAIKIPSIGSADKLDETEFLQICKILKINPFLLQKPKGGDIELLIGINALSLLGNQVTQIINNGQVTKIE